MSSLTNYAKLYSLTYQLSINTNLIINIQSNFGQNFRLQLTTFNYFYYQNTPMSQNIHSSNSTNNYYLQSQKQDNNVQNIPYKLQQAPLTTEQSDCIRKNMIKIFSRVQFVHNTLHDSLFLAISIFDSYCKVKPILDIKIEDGLACMMLSLKYEQIYLPSITEVQRIFSINLSPSEYLKIQKKVLKALNYNVNLDGPQKHFCKFPHLISRSNELRIYTYFLIEIAFSEKNIIETYSWQEILGSIQLLIINNQFNKTNQSINQQTNQTKSLPLTNCCRQLIKTKHFLESRNPQLHNKYGRNINYQCSTRQLPAFMGTI